MHRTRLPLTLWFWAIYLCATDKRGISAVQLSHTLGICYDSAWHLLDRIRTAMGQRDEKYLLSGIVELNDGYVSGPSHISCSVASRDAVSNIIFDFGIIISQIFVLILNYKKNWYEMIGMNDVKKNVIFSVLCFLLAGILVGISCLVLLTNRSINYLGNGFAFCERTEVYRFISILFVRMLIVGIAEELLFRGVLAKHIMDLWGEKMAVIFSTLVFTVFHCMVIQCWSQVTDIFFMGRILGIFYVKTKSIICSVAFHSGIDFFTNLVGMQGQVALLFIESEKGELYVASNLFLIMSILGIIVLIGLKLINIWYVRKREEINR